MRLDVLNATGCACINQKGKFPVNAIIKFGGVSGEALAPLFTTIGIGPASLARVLEVKPESEKTTYLVTLQLNFRDSTESHDLVSAETLLRIFRSLDRGILPNEPRFSELKEIAVNLLPLMALAGKASPCNFYRHERNGGDTILQKGEILTMNTIMSELVPNISGLDIDNIESEEEKAMSELFSGISKAQKAAQLFLGW